MAGFRHVVLFRWREGTTEEQKRTLEERLRELPGLIPELKSYSLGADAGLNPGNFEFAIVADFANRDAYAIYRDHPEHRRVIDQCVTPIAAERAAVQYEM
jgi:hypothetical protein